MKRTIIGGLPIEVGSTEECETADMVICVLTGTESEQFKSTNIYTRCADCGRSICHRPYVPKTPPKVCMECAVKRIEAANDKR